MPLPLDHWRRRTLLPVFVFSMQHGMPWVGKREEPSLFPRKFESVLFGLIARLVTFPGVLVVAPLARRMVSRLVETGR